MIGGLGRRSFRAPDSPVGCVGLLVALGVVTAASFGLPDNLALNLLSIVLFWGILLVGLVSLAKVARRDRRVLLVGAALGGLVLAPLLFIRLAYESTAAAGVVVLLSAFAFLLALLAGGFVLLRGLGRALHPANRLVEQSRLHERGQGRVGDAEVLRIAAMPPPTQVGRFLLEPGLPLGYVSDVERAAASTRPVGLPPDGDTGHVAVIAPTRSGKSFHLTDTLMRWPGPAVVIDPKGEQWERTAGYRAACFGPVYRIPPQGLDLGELYDLDSDLDRRELHEVQLRPWQDGDEKRIFADKALAILEAAVVWGRARGEHPLRVAARWARMSPVQALSEAEEHAPAEVTTFTDGVGPGQVVSNRFALSSWGVFSTRFSPFAAHVDTVARADVPLDWAGGCGTIYATFPLQAQAAVGPLAAALVRGLMRRLQAQRPAQRALFAVDEMPTVKLPHLAASLATVGGSGITMLLYAQSVPQIEATYGRQEAMSILSNCTSQVYYAPRDPQTAQLVSENFGTRLEIAESRGWNAGSALPGATTTQYSTRYQPALEKAEAMSLPQGVTAVFSHGLRYLAGASIWYVPDRLPDLPPPPGLSEASGAGLPPPTLPLEGGHRAEIGAEESRELAREGVTPPTVEREPYW